MSGFDPDQVARDFGEEHLIPPNVRPLTDAELRSLFPREYRLLHGEAAADSKQSPRPAAGRPTLGRVLGGIEL
jgi:hypothetical protein